MKSKFNYLPIFILVLITAGFVKQDSDRYYQIAKSIDIFGRIYKEVNTNYVDQVDPEEFMLAGIKGMLNSLDPYTVYLDQTSQKDMHAITSGKYGGIGVTVALHNGRVTVVDLIEGYSAQRQGIIIGDVIIKIDSTEINSSNYEKLGDFLKKEPGTEITVVIDREGIEHPLVFNLISEQIEIKNITYYGFVPTESNNAYIKLSGFSRTAGNELKNVIEELNEAKEIESIVLDLRGNPGGLLDAAVSVSEKFLEPDLLIVSVKGRDQSRSTEFFSKEQPVAKDKKLVVLIDNGSASASEIVAGAIQDHDRGIILGTASFGKGLVQTIFPLPYNTSLKMTTAKYYTPSGRSIQKIDYSENNKVFAEPDSLKIEGYQTDNKRTVFSAGGIEPDTIVTSAGESQIIKNLLAKGMFFKFATRYYNNNNVVNIDSLKDHEIIDDFLSFVKENEFDYRTKAENLLDQLMKNSEKDDNLAQLEEQLLQIKIKYAELKNKELLEHKNEILVEVKTEIAARIGGRSGRIVESLKYDGQFNAAVSIANNINSYNKLLKIDY
ncbi:MAG: S41 family peptidase [Melioribacteraceae bacterium]|nr:S41 family peptidase [Melioribacteraceae bacterium]